MNSDLEFAKELRLFKGVPMHGNYGGPGYTGGVVGANKGDYHKPPSDVLDSHYRDHDYAYEHGSWRQRRAADTRLAAESYDHGLKGKLTSAVFAIKGLGITGDPLGAPPLGKMSNGPSGWDAARALTRNRDMHALEGNKKYKQKKSGRVASKKKGRKFGKVPRMTLTSQPVARSMAITTPDNNSGHSERGIIRLGVVTPATTSLGCVAFLQDLAPREVGGRLAAIADTYANYHFVGGRLTYVPIVATSTVGQLLVTRDHDPTTWPYAGVVDIDAESQKAGRMTVAVRDCWSMTIAGDKRELFVNPDPLEARTTSPGYVTVSAGSSLSAGTEYGTLEFEYHYVFTHPLMHVNRRYLLLQAGNAPPLATTAWFPLHPDGTDGSHSVALPGDTAWRGFVNGTNYDKIAIPPYTNFWVRVTIVGTGLAAGADLYPGNAGITIDYYSELPSATHHTFVASAHTGAQTGTLQFYSLDAGDTVTYRELLLVPLAWNAYVNVAPVALKSADNDVERKVMSTQKWRGRRLPQEPRIGIDAEGFEVLPSQQPVAPSPPGTQVDLRAAAQAASLCNPTLKRNQPAQR